MAPEGFKWHRRYSSKLECLTCGRTGYSGGSWMDDCRAGHPVKCDTCGRVFTGLSGKSAHEQPRRAGGKPRFVMGGVGKKVT